MIVVLVSMFRSHQHMVCWLCMFQAETGQRSGRLRLGELKALKACAMFRPSRLPNYMVRILAGVILGEIMGPATFAGAFWN